MKLTVAIDGPAAAGKGTISRAVAAHFGLAYLDTGQIYRAVGARVAEGMAPLPAAQTLTEADLARPDLRSAAAGRAASEVAALPEVRAALVDFQRAFATRAGGAVLDGRDIGTVICPEADVKLFVTASAEVRAHRRWLELRATEPGLEVADVLAEIRARDDRDSQRTTAPLKPAKDAITLDTSRMSITQAIARAVEIVGKAVPPAPDRD